MGANLKGHFYDSTLNVTKFRFQRMQHLLIRGIYKLKKLHPCYVSKILLLILPAEIVKEILNLRPDFARKTTVDGWSPLHLACSKGHLETTRELLSLDPDLSFLQDQEGKTPLHWAATKGRVNVLDEILSTSLESSEMLTKNGETVLHLAVKNNQYEAVRFLMETLNITRLMNMPDNDGNTILHLATAGKLRAVRILLWDF